MRRRMRPTFKAEAPPPASQSRECLNCIGQASKKPIRSQVYKKPGVSNTRQERAAALRAEESNPNLFRPEGGGFSVPWVLYPW